MKKTVAYFIVAALVLATASFAFAAPNQMPMQNMQNMQGNGMMCGMMASDKQLTDAQKQELAPIMEKMFAAKKEMIQKHVKFGTITQEQADAQIAQMEKCKEACMQNGGCGMMGGGMMGGMHNGMGKGMGGMGQGMGKGCPMMNQQQTQQQ